VDIAGTKIKPGRAYLIAEIGLNHQGRLHLAKVLVDAAKEAGADAVKFQKRKLSSLYHAEYLDNPNLGEQGLGYLLPILREFELSDDDFREILAYCREIDLTFLCSPWDRPSVDFLESENLPAYKIASADLTNFHLLEYVAATNKPMICSTGMSTLTEIDRSVAFLREQQADFALLHCNSTYPAPFHNINLNFMKTLADRYGVPVGYSGHEKGIAVSEAAVAMGATIIERHFTIDRTLRGPDHAASLEVPGFRKLVRDIRNVEKAMGSAHKWVSRGEIMNRESLGKSLVAARDIAGGQTIARDDVTVRSPARGVSPQRLYNLVGNPAKRPIAAGEYFREEDFAVDFLTERRVESTLKWGIPTRFSDIAHLFHPDLFFYEFHLTDGDLQDGLGELPDYDAYATMHAPEYWRDDLLDLCSPSPRVRQITIDTVNRALDIARALKAKFAKIGNAPIMTVVHPGGMTLEIEPIDPRRLYDNLKASVASLNTEGVDLLLENMPPLPWYFGGQWQHHVFLDAKEILAVCRELQIGLCLDVSHAQLACNWGGWYLLDYLETLLPVTRHIHLADGAGLDGEGLQIGEGEIDFAAVMPLAARTDRPLLLEIWQGHKFGGDGFWLALRRLETILQGKG